MQVASILASKGRSVVTAKPGASIPEIAQVLKSKKIGAAVVVDDGRPLGVLTEKDCADVDRFAQVKDVMHAGPVTIDADADPRAQQGAGEVEPGGRVRGGVP